MDRWLILCFQVGHVAEQLGKTLLVIHEVAAYGTFNGHPAFPQRGPNPQETGDNGIERPAGEGAVSGGQSQDRDDPVETRSESGGHPGGVEAPSEAPVVIEEKLEASDFEATPVGIVYD